MATLSTALTASYEIAPLGLDVRFGAIVSGLTLGRSHFHSERLRSV
jgi:hypothetical protein